MSGEEQVKNHPAHVLDLAVHGFLQSPGLPVQTDSPALALGAGRAKLSCLGALQAASGMP
jgi:hypothetical protein